ncbi:hypothetical protein ACFY36_12715 [Actinoplanes sp. NPDC000266]
MAVLNARGKITLLRVNERDDRFGPPDDFITAEVIVQLDREPNRAFGFRLLDDGNLPVRRAYLDLLRDALAHDHEVHIDFDLPPGKTKGRIMRCWLTPGERLRPPGGVFADRAVLTKDAGAD